MVRDFSLLWTIFFLLSRLPLTLIIDFFISVTCWLFFSGHHYKLEKLLSLFEEAKINFQTEESLFCVAIRACGQCLSWQLALSIFEELEQSWRPGRGTIISSRDGGEERLEEFTEEMTTETEMTERTKTETEMETITSNGVTAGVKAYNEAMAACYKSQQYTVIEELWLAIRKDGIEPDSESYGIMLLTVAHGSGGEGKGGDGEAGEAGAAGAAAPTTAVESNRAAKKQRLEYIWTEEMRLSTSVVVEPSKSTYASCMAAWIVVGDYNKAMSVGRECFDHGHLDDVFLNVGRSTDEIILSKCPLTSGSDGQVDPDMVEAVVRLFVDNKSRCNVSGSSSSTTTFKVWTQQASVPKMIEGRKKDLHNRVLDVLNSILIVNIICKSFECVEFTTRK